MGESTAIAWTDATFNPWWGCTRVSPGCQHCYAESFAKRVGHPLLWGKGGGRRFFGMKHWAEPLRWDRAAAEEGRPRLVFCGSMCDVFEDRDDLIAERERLWALIDRTPNLTWQLLTKRPENVLDMVPAYWLEHVDVAELGSRHREMLWNWPPNVWVGTTVEDQQRADERIPRLLEIPADVRFLSCEPLLGQVQLRLEWLTPTPDVVTALGGGHEIVSARTPGDVFQRVRQTAQRYGWRGIDWVIAGGESGPGHRPLELDHARLLRDQVIAAGVPFFFKQVGGRTPTAGSDTLDGETWKQLPAGVGR